MAKIKIAIDTSMMDGRQAKGTAIVIRKHIEGLASYIKKNDDIEITLIHKFAQTKDLLYKEFEEIIIPRIWNGPMGGFINEFLFFINYWIQIFLGKKEKFDIYFVCYSRILPSFILAPGKKFMFYPMDGGPSTQKGNTVMTKTPFAWYVIFFKNKIDKFFALTEFGQRGIMQVVCLPKEKVPILNCGVEDIYSPAINKQEVNKYMSTKYNIPQKYILCVSRWDPHKNILNFLDAYKKYLNSSSEKLPLVFVGGKHMPDYSSLVDKKITELNLQNFISVAPFVDTIDMPKMYQAAEYMVFPSFYEGFGLPVVEAMACGCPTVLSNVDALKEVGGESSIYFDPNNVDEMSEKILELENSLKDNIFKNSYINKGVLEAKKYKWENATGVLVNIFKNS